MRADLGCHRFRSTAVADDDQRVGARQLRPQRRTQGAGGKYLPVAEPAHAVDDDQGRILDDRRILKSVAGLSRKRGRFRERTKRVLSAHLKPDETQVAQLRGKRVLAFAGIGDPARFFSTLRASSVDVVRERAFADHHPYSQGEIDYLIAEASRDGLTLVTTEKDLARLQDKAQPIVPFAVTLEFDDAARLRKFVTDRLFKARERRAG